MTKRQQGKTAKARCVLPLPPFRLPGDAEPLPAMPCSVEELFSGEFAMHLHAMTEAGPEGLEFVWAGAALRELWNWLARHAESGNIAAQGELFDSALIIVQAFLAGARKKLPGIVNRARGANAIPGLISRDPDWQNASANLCREIGQGAVFPFPLEPPGAQSRKKKAKLFTSHHDLVNRLFDYIEGRRLLRQWHPFATRAQIEKQKASGYFVAPLLEKMLALPPLSPATWEKWRDVGRLVIEASTNGNPAQHPAFQTGGFFASLGPPDARAQRHEIVLWKRLSEAWKLRAQEMARLPEKSLSRSDFSGL
jgi:hypothetical protein